MKTLHSCCNALGIGIAAAILAACGGSQPAAPLFPAMGVNRDLPFTAAEQQPAVNGALSWRVVTPKNVTYRLVDMGTFGGPTSQGTNLNLHGETTVMGWSSLPFHWGSHAHPLICGGSDHFIKQVTHAFQWREGHVADLGSLGGPRSCSIESQSPPNARGDFVGLSENGELDLQTGVNQSRAVLWRDEHIRDLGSFGGNQNGGNQINDSGQIVGFSLNTVPDQYSFMDFIFLGSTTGTQTRAFLWQNGRMRDLGTLGTGNDAWAFYINRRGQITGAAYTNTTPSSVFGFPTIDPFFWNGHRMIDMGTLGGTFSLPAAMNDRGEVVGTSYLSDESTQHPFYWNGSTMIDIGTAGGSQGGAGGINDNSEVIGSTTTVGDQYWRAFVWKNGVRTDLPPLPGDCGSQAWGIDSRGRVIGNSTLCGVTYPAFGAHNVVIWDHGTIINVNKLVARGASLQIAQVGGLSQAGPGVLNDRGEIAGIGVPPGVPRYNAYKKGRAFLLIPDDILRR